MAGFKALILASVALLALTRLAPAADLLPPPPALEPPSAVADLGGWYLRGDLGAAFNYGSNLKLQNSPEPLPGSFGLGANESFNNTTVSASVLGDFGVGYQFNTWLRGDITGEYRDGGHFQSTYLLNNPSPVNLITNPLADQHTQYVDFYRANTSSIVGLANVYADLGTWYGITPFVGGGLGVAYNRLYGMTDQGQNTTVVPCNGTPCKYTGPSGGYFKDGATTNLAWALMAGLDFNITQNLKLELGYRYLNVGKISSGGSNCANGDGTGNGFSLADCGGGVPNFVSSRTTLASNDFRIGLRWMLGDPYGPPPSGAPFERKY